MLHAVSIGSKVLKYIKITNFEYDFSVTCALVARTNVLCFGVLAWRDTRVTKKLVHWSPCKKLLCSLCTYANSMTFNLIDYFTFTILIQCQVFG